jgi:hypothetical protein
VYGIGHQMPLFHFAFYCAAKSRNTGPKSRRN